MTRPKPILFAPTASGKTKLSLQLAQEFSLEIVCADAFTVYKDLDRGTAKPSLQERREVPHHLLDVADVTQQFDVHQFVKAAEQALSDIESRGKQALVVGGTGFYLSALMKGLPLTPPSDPNFRREIETELENVGLEALLDEINMARPEEVARMERNPRRVVRAIEIYRRTGQFPSEFGFSTPRFSYQLFGFSPPFAELEHMIAQRTEQLWQGWQEEALALEERVSPHEQPRPTAWQALGYREALAAAKGQLSPTEAKHAIALQTRQYAKRQLTWLRSQTNKIYSPAEVKNVLSAWLETSC